MDQPSFCFYSSDVGKPHYKMWKTIVGADGMTVHQLVAEIFAANMIAVRSEASPHKNIALNTHDVASQRLRAPDRRSGALSLSAERPPQYRPYPRYLARAMMPRRGRRLLQAALGPILSIIEGLGVARRC